MGLAAGDLVGGQDGHDPVDTFGALQDAGVLEALVADHRDHRPLGADDDVILEAHLPDKLNDVLDIGALGAFTHDYDHITVSSLRTAARRCEPLALLIIHELLWYCRRLMLIWPTAG